MVEWTLENCPKVSYEDGPFILDIGTGNGILPICLVEAGYNASTICGIDYSKGAIELAEGVAVGRHVEGITFRAVDFLNGAPGSLGEIHTEITTKLGSKKGNWDLLLDKGTFDAIALSGPSDGPHPTDLYPQRVEEFLTPGGYFLITSCNFTEEEIKSHIVSKVPLLKYHSRVEHPTFTFGGKSGSLCCTVAFRKEVPVDG